MCGKTGQQQKSDSLLNKLIVAVVLFVIFTAAGGAVGYLSQSGFLDYVKREQLAREGYRHSDEYDRRTERMMERVTREEYRRQTRRGWWIGCGIGAAAGASFLVRTHMGRPRDAKPQA